jgi:hypothetical protein
VSSVRVTGWSSRIFRCHVCGADLAGRGGQPLRMIFRDGGSYACRDHLSPQREVEIRKREKERSFKPGSLR